MKKQKRIFTTYASQQIKDCIKILKDGQEVATYRRAMFDLGIDLGDRIVRSNPRSKYFYVVCTVEDADYLASGIMQTLGFNNKHFNMACFWNQRERLGSINERISPVIRRYVEPCARERATMIIVKSLISGGCVVKTNISESIDKIKPSKIIVAAPIMHKDAKGKLKDEFDKSIFKKFDFLYYATDHERDQRGIVQPGLGDVYKLLGFGSQKAKNKSTPVKVRERRAIYA